MASAFMIAGERDGYMEHFDNYRQTHFPNYGKYWYLFDHFNCTCITHDTIDYDGTYGTELNCENFISTLKEGTIIDNFNHIRTDLTLISYLSYITELVAQVVKQSSNPNIYKLYISTIKKIDEGLNPMVMTNILEIKLLDYLGVPINLNECCKCGSKKNIITVDPDAGGYICTSCYTNEIMFDEKVRNMLRKYYLVDIESITELKIKDYVIESINYFMNTYYDRYTGLYIHSKNFLNRNINY